MLIDDKDFASFMGWLAYQDEIAIDTETQGLDAYAKGHRICGVSINGHDGSAVYLPFRHYTGYNLPRDRLRDFIGLLNDRVGSGALNLMFWNAKFDLHMLAADGFRMPDRNVEDFMLAAHLLNENEPKFGLKEYGDKYGFGRGSLDEAELRDVIEAQYGKTKASEWKGYLHKLPADRVAPYAETDAVLTMQAAKAIRPALATWKLDGLFAEINEYMLLITRMEQRGVKIDRPKILKHMEELGPRREEGFYELLAIVDHMTGSTLDPTPRPVTIGKRGKPLKTKPSLTFNPNSVPQLQYLTGWPKTDVRYLEELTDDDPFKRFAELVLDHRVMSKMTGTYYDAYLELSDVFDVLRPNYNMHGTVSGRLSCSKPNLQNVPRYTPRRPVKEAFIPQDDGVTDDPIVFVEMDYQQAELRIAAHYAGETRMKALFYAGEDPHGATAQKLGIARFVAKTLNFLIIYGGGVRAIMRTLRCSEEVARAYLRGYHGLYTNFSKLSSYMQERAIRDGYIRLESGRIRHFNTWKRYEWEAEPRKAMNSLIQGTASEMLRIAMVRLDYAIRALGIDARLILQVHDSLLLECRRSHLSRLLPLLDEISTDFGFDPRPAIDVKIGNRWAPMETVAA